MSFILPLLIISGYIYGNDKLNDTYSFNSFNLYHINHQWLNTGNFAGLTFNPDKNISNVIGGFDLNKGSYHRIREASEKQDYFVQTESYKKINKLNFYGNFSYHNSSEKGALWNGVFSPYRGNPYIIGDSIPGANYHKETYQLKGGIATKINNKFSVGCLLDYFVGIGAKQMDPRPESTVMQFKVNPALIIHNQNSNIGIDAGFRIRKEDINYIQVVTADPDPTFFTFKGMGFYTNEINYGINRFQSEQDIFGGIQYEKSILGFESLTEIRTNYSVEAIEDGSSSVKKDDAGDWKTINIRLNQQLLTKKDNSIHKIHFSAAYFNGNGIEYTQEGIPDDDRHINYVTQSKNLKFNRNTISGNIEYNYLKFSTDEKVNWNIKAFGEFVMNNEKYHYIPEIFSADYSNIESGFEIQKNFYSKKIHFAPGFSATYKYNLSNNLLLSNNSNITKKQNKELYTDDLNFYTENLLKITGKLYVGIDAKKFKNIDQIYLKINYHYWHAFDLIQHQQSLIGKIGFVF